jgi:ABC-type branched-subunit amino acid transport system ATPase component
MIISVHYRPRIPPLGLKFLAINQRYIPPDISVIENLALGTYIEDIWKRRHKMPQMIFEIFSTIKGKKEP